MSGESIAQPSLLERAKALILTPREQTEQPAAHIDEPRYVIELANNGKELTYFGARHTNDPGNPIFDEIQEAFEKARPQKIYFEGWAASNIHTEQAREYISSMTLEQAKQNGESIFLLKLAVDAGIPFESPEPVEADMFAHLTKLGFSGRDIFMQIFHRQMHQYLRETKEPSLEACKIELGRYFDRFRKESNLSVEELDLLEDEAFASIDLAAGDFYSDNADPVPWPDKPMTRSKEVSAASTVYRDQFALGRIAAGLNEYDRVFAVYGRNHAIALEPALKALMNVQ